MLMPKRVKYRKVQRGRMTGAASRGNKVAYGDFGIQALEPGWITGNQIEAARIAMTRYTKRGGKVWIKIFPDKPYSKKGNRSSRDRFQSRNILSRNDGGRGQRVRQIWRRQRIPCRNQVLLRVRR